MNITLAGVTTVALLVGFAILVIACAVICAGIINRSLIRKKDDRLYYFVLFNKAYDGLVPDGYHLNKKKDKVNFDPRFPEMEILPNKWGPPTSFDEISLEYQEIDKEYKENLSTINEFLDKYGLYFPGLHPFVKQKRIKFSEYKRVDISYVLNTAKGEFTVYKDETYHYICATVERDTMFFEPKLELPAKGLDTIGSDKDANAPMVLVNLMSRMTIVCCNLKKVFSGTPDILMDAYQAVTAGEKDIASSMTFRELQLCKNEAVTDANGKTFVQQIKELINQDTPGGNSSSKKLYGIMLKHLNLFDIIPGDAKAKEYIDSYTDVATAKNTAQSFKEETEGIRDRKLKLGLANNEVLKKKPITPDVDRMATALEKLATGNLKYLSIGGGNGLVPTIQVNTDEDEKEEKQTTKKEKKKDDK